MSFDPESERYELFNAFRTAIHHGTHGLIRGLSLTLFNDCVVVRGASPSYYGAQLVIHTTHEFAEAHPLFPKTRLFLNVDGKPLELVIGHSVNWVAGVSQSICVADVASS